MIDPAKLRFLSEAEGSTGQISYEGIIDHVTASTRARADLRAGQPTKVLPPQTLEEPDELRRIVSAQEHQFDDRIVTQRPPRHKRDRKPAVELPAAGSRDTERPPVAIRAGLWSRRHDVSSLGERVKALIYLCAVVTPSRDESLKLTRDLVPVHRSLPEDAAHGMPYRHCQRRPKRSSTSTPSASAIRMAVVSRGSRRPESIL